MYQDDNMMDIKLVKNSANYTIANCVNTMNEINYAANLFSIIKIQETFRNYRYKKKISETKEITDLKSLSKYI